MDIVSAGPPAVYAFSVVRAADETPDAPTYEPVTAEWSERDVDEWLDACARDDARESGGGW